MPTVTAPTQDRELAAELAVLSVFDLQRSIKGHDYGGGQRRTELGRRERRLPGTAVTLAYHAAGVKLPESMLRDAGEPLTIDELRAAWETVGRPRLLRIERETYRRETPGTRRTLAAWREVQTWLADGGWSAR